MVRGIVRPIAVVLLVPLTIQMAGCYGPPRGVATSQIEDPNDELVVGVTTAVGDSIWFDEARPPKAGESGIQPARVRNDTLYASVQGRPYTLPVHQVQRYWIRNISTGRTIGLVAGVAAGTFLALLAIAAATKESCPFIYSWDGSQWVFDAEPYGGATTRGLERDDFSELEHLKAVDGEYRLLVANEVPETQHTNQTELIVIDHRPDTQIVVGGGGEIHAIRSLTPPIEAEDAEGQDLIKWFHAGDGIAWEPLPEPNADDRLEIRLVFPKPLEAQHATLVARVGTGIWGSYMIKAMLELHGNELDDWYAALDERPSAVDSLIAWNLREELYALQVQVEEPQGWRTRGVLHGGGPFVLEDRPVLLDVSEVAGERLRVRLRPPRGFWSLDAFAVSYDDPDAPVHVQRLTPMEARDQRGKDLLPALSGADDVYYSMPSNDDRAVLRFDAPPLPNGLERTVFLHSRGWYRIHLDDTGPPDLESLRRIAVIPGAAARYAAERFFEWTVARR